MKTAVTTVVAGLIVLSSIASAKAQEVVQTINFALTVYNQATDTTVRPVRLTTKDVIRLLNDGTPVQGGKLLLVVPMGEPPVTGDNLGDNLRVTGTDGTSFDTTTDTFNIYQDFFTVTQTSNKTTTYAINRFSIDMAQLHSELQGYTTWSANSKTPGGQGSFKSTVNGWVVIDGVTPFNTPASGTISASAPKLSQQSQRGR